MRQYVLESLLGQILVALSAVIAALIAGAFAYFSLVVTKETKVSEFRQTWIDSLRSEISTYISRLHAVSTLGQYIHANPLEDRYNPDLLRERSRLYEEALSAYNSILLRINPNETRKQVHALNTAFLNALRTAQRFYEAGHTEALEDNLEQLSEAAAPLLKYEWDRVRSGEPAYTRAKITSLTIAIVSGVAALLLMLAAILYLPRDGGSKAPHSVPLEEVPASAAKTPNVSKKSPAMPSPEATK